MRVFFPRLSYRLRHGHWCPHIWGPSIMINDGMQKIHDCVRCGYAESLR